MTLKEENLITRQHYTNEGIRCLMAAVCIQAIKDYKSPYTTKSNKEDIKRFFGDWMFSYFTNDMTADEIAELVDHTNVKLTLHEVRNYVK